MYRSGSGSDSKHKDDGAHGFFASVWRDVKLELRRIYGDAIYDNWLAQMQLLFRNGCGEVAVAVQTRFMKEWIAIHYLDQILSLWQKKDPAAHRVSIEVLEDVQQRGTAVTPVTANHFNPHQEYSKGISSYDDIGSPLDTRFTFRDFVVAKSNELAFAAAQRVAKSSEPVYGSNPLFLYGGVGLGKTHLMHAIAWDIIRNNAPARRVAYLSAERFMYKYINALKNKDIMVFKEHFRSVDVLMVDDVQFISGKENTQEEFFHTFNALIDQNKQLVISADRSPSDLDGVEERIRSRLGWGLVADINETTFELRLGILQSKKDRLDLDVRDEVLEFLAQNIKSNVRELEGALNKIVAHASLTKKEMTVDLASDILADLIRANNKVVTVDEIQTKVADFFGIKVADMHSVRRQRNLVRPRQIAMYLAKKLTTKSLPDIGRHFGGRDHATVIHAVKQVEKLISDDVKLSEDVGLLTKILKQ